MSPVAPAPTGSRGVPAPAATPPAAAAASAPLPRREDTAAAGPQSPPAPFLQRLMAAANGRDPGPARPEGAGLRGQGDTEQAEAAPRERSGGGKEGGTAGRWTSMLQSPAVAAASAPARAPLRPLDLLAVWRADSADRDANADKYGRAAAAAAARRSRLAGSSRWRALWPAGVAARRGRAGAARAAPASKVGRVAAHSRPRWLRLGT